MKLNSAGGAPIRGPKLTCAMNLPTAMAVIKPMLPNKPRGVARLNDRRVLNDIQGPGAVRSRTESGHTVDRRSTHASTRKTLGRGVTLPIRS
jgi:hypothetical protein